MERKIALFTVHELIVALADSPFRKYLVVEPTLTASDSSEEHVIRIESTLDEKTHKIIQPIIQKRNLRIEKLENALVIY